MLGKLGDRGVPQVSKSEVGRALFADDARGGLAERLEVAEPREDDPPLRCHRFERPRRPRGQLQGARVGLLVDQLAPKPKLGSKCAERLICLLSPT